MKLALPPWSNLDPPYTGVFQVMGSFHRGCAPYHASRRLSDQFDFPRTLILSLAGRIGGLGVVQSECAPLSVPSNLWDGAANCLSHGITEKIREVAA